MMKWISVISLLVLAGGSFRLASQSSEAVSPHQMDVRELISAEISVDFESTEQSLDRAVDESVLPSASDLVPEPGPDLRVLKSQRRQPIRHSAALHESMITPGNFEYLGGFRPPSSTDDEHTFSYGGWGIAWRPDGDPDGAKDGYPGSLYLVGHQQSQEVAEISIPKPVVSADDRMDDLPVSEILQPFHDVTSGLMARMNVEQTTPFNIGGLQVTQGVLHWTIHKYYNVDGIDYPSHGVSPLRAFEWSPAGPWHLGPMRSGSPEWHSYKHAGYIFEVPESEAKEWFGGRNLISGLQISTGLQASSQGPAMFAYQLPERGTPAETSLSAVPLVWYSQQQPLVGHHPADRWSGGAWLTLGDKQAVVIVGRKALGEFYYGEPRPQDCSPYKGYHGPPYEFQMLFYSPASLIHAAHGSLRAESVEPWLRWDSHFEGGGPGHYIFPSCGQDIGGMTYDRERNLLYIVQVNAGHTSDNEYELLPVIHVFRIAE